MASGSKMDITFEITGSEAQADALRQDLAGAFPENKPATCQLASGAAP